MKFEEINIRQDPDAVSTLRRLGVMATPALLIGERIIVGFDPGEIDHAVSALGQI